MSKAAKRSARERLREEQRRRAERARRRRRLVMILAPVLVIVIVVAAGVAVQALRDRGGEFAGNLPAAELTEYGSVRLAASGAGAEAPVIDVYEDFQCPACKEFERVSGERLKKLVSERQVVVVYHPVAIIDQRSIRAGSAAQCAADEGMFMEYHDVLFESQPPERGGQGFTAEELLDYGEQVGLDGASFSECVESVRYRDEILRRTEDISTKHQQQTGSGFGTPTVHLNGQPIDPNLLFRPDAFERTVLEAPAPTAPTTTPPAEAKK